MPITLNVQIFAEFIFFSFYLFAFFGPFREIRFREIYKCCRWAFFSKICLTFNL